MTAVQVRIEDQRLLDRLRPATSLGRIGVVEGVFLLATFLAPMDVFLVAGFTAHDLLIAVTAVLMLVERRRLDLAPELLLPAMGAFLLAALLSAFRAHLPIQALAQVAQFAFIFFVQLPVVLAMVRSRKLVRETLMVFVCGELTAIAISMVLRRETGAHRLTAFYTDNPNRLGYPAAYLLPFVLHLVFRRWRKGHRLQAVAGGTVACYLLGWALMASASRGGTVGLLVALPLFLIFRDGSRSPYRLGARIATLVGAGVVVVMLILHTSLFPDTLRTRVTRTFGAEESLTQDRERLADAGLQAFEESPFIGTGLDNFRYVARDYQDHVTDQAPHNLWIQFLAQIGVIGTAAFLCLLLIWFELHAKALGRIGRGEGYECIVAFMCSFAALMVILMTIPIMNQRHYWLLYALGLAFVTNYAGASTERTSEASHADHGD